MKHEIDLSKYEVRTDLAIESINQDEINTIDTSVKEIDNVTVTNIKLDKESASKIGKLPGNYITIEFDDVTDYTNKEKVKKIFSKCLKELLNTVGIKKHCCGLIVGLGNDNSTPDALGPTAINNIIVTRHLYELGDVEEGFMNVAAINPGVMGQTGIETVSVIKGVVKEMNPDFVIVVDALKSQSIDRVNKTIQMTDTGIHPGSGVGNTRKEISSTVLGVPVIAIGVPTVVDLVTVVSDTVGFMHKHYSYIKNNMHKPSYKLKPTGSVNYLKEEVEVSAEDKSKLLGMLGSLDENEIKQLFFEVLTPIGYNLIVTPKEVDFIIEKLSDVIGNGINMAIHENVKN